MKQQTHHTSYATSCAFLAFAFLFLMTNAAFAQGGGSGGTFDLCGIIDTVFYANIAPGIATLAVIALGIGASFGKVSWGMAVLAGVGIAAIFGAGALAASAGGGC
jgi:type IV secretory pathway VirB2 component (pilin)